MSSRPSLRAHYFPRLNTLSDERSTIQHAVWDLSDSPISRVLLSRPWFFKTLKLLYSYYALVQDIKVLMCQTVYLSLSLNFFIRSLSIVPAYRAARPTRPLVRRTRRRTWLYRRKTGVHDQGIWAKTNG